MISLASIDRQSEPIRGYKPQVQAIHQRSVELVHGRLRFPSIALYKGAGSASPCDAYQSRHDARLFASEPRFVAPHVLCSDPRTSRSGGRLGSISPRSSSPPFTFPKPASSKSIVYQSALRSNTHNGGTTEPAGCVLRHHHRRREGGTDKNGAVQRHGPENGRKVGSGT